MKLWIVGIDIGGTKISVSLGHVDRAKPVAPRLRKEVFSSKGGRDPKESVREMQSTVLGLLRELRLKVKEVRGIGLAVAGAIDTKRGIIVKSPHLRGWEKFPLRTFLLRLLGRPVFIENDCNAAVLGEQYFGLGRGIRDFMYVTVSTGIGSGIVVNGSLVRGTGGAAGELGHMTIVRNGDRCPCGKRGCLEAYASGTAIANYVKKALKNGSQSRFWKSYHGRDIGGEIVSLAAQKGDRLAIRAREVAADYLGIGLANVIHLLNPKRIILGGGVMEQIEHFWRPMMKAVRRETWASANRSCQILRSRLGNRVGDFGAVAVVLSREK